jgi:2-dehydropantoate 2-reductase
MRFAEQFAPETKSSMLGDLEAGGKLEVRWLSGAVARMSAEAGLDAPVNRAVFAALKPWQDGIAGR